MRTEAASGLISQADLTWEQNNWQEDYTSACQLQLARLVQQFSARAAWLIYRLDACSHYQVFKVISPSHQADLVHSSPDLLELTLKVLDLDPLADCLDQVNQVSIEIKADLWEFSTHLPGFPQLALVGVKFYYSMAADWVYLILGCMECYPSRDCLTNPAEQLQPELGFLKAAIKLDQKYNLQQQQTEQYQKILRRIEHQLRNPLAIIHLYAANLHSSLQQETDRHQAAAIGEAVHHLSSHLTELISGCQRAELERDLCSIPALWTEAWQGLQLMAQATQVQLSLPSQSLQIEGDRVQLLQVFENLLHNALCFSPLQGKIDLHWQGFHQEILITIADQGPGLSATDFQHMFRPYYSTRPQGSGLGLTIAHQIVAAHRGKLWADNLPGGGAQFSIVLPCHAVSTT